MSKPSVAAHLKAMDGQKVIMRVTGIPTIEDMDTMRQQLKDLLVANNIPAEQLAEDDRKFYIKDSTQFWMKPKLKAVTQGTLKVRSKDYLFIEDGKTEDSALYGDKKGLTFAMDQVKVEKVINLNPKVGGLISYELVA